MNSHKNRLDKIDSQLPEEPNNEDTLQVLAADVLLAIDAGHIRDWCDMPQERDFDYTSLISPTVSDDLNEEDRRKVYSLLERAQRTVAALARFTGWRSPAAKDAPQEWKGFRANSALELAAIMREIRNYATQ